MSNSIQIHGNSSSSSNVPAVDTSSNFRPNSAEAAEFTGALKRCTGK